MPEFDVCALGELLIDFTENGIKAVRFMHKAVICSSESPD